MLQQKVNNSLAGDVIRRLEAQLGELPVLTDKIGWGIGEQVKKPLVVGLGWRVLEVFDDVELDAPLAQEVQRAPAMASAGVVIDA